MEKENVMGTKPIKSLVLSTGVPLMFSLLISSLYNFVDSVYVSRIGEAALTALSLAAPIQMVSSALGSGIAVGLNAVISKALGEKNHEKVKESAFAAIALGFCSWIALMIFGLLLCRPYFEWQANGNQEIVNHGVQYLSIVMTFSLGFMGQWIFDRFTIASGKSKLFIITLSSGAITNIILDPIFIFGYFGLPAMGTAGAAIATVIGQFVGAAMGYIINKKYNKEIPIVFSLKPNFKYMKEILTVGIPTMIVQGLVSITGVFMATVLSSFSSTAVAVNGVCAKVQSLSLVPVWGINNGVVPIVAYNYGANKKERILETVKWALRYEYLMVLVICGLIWIFPTFILQIFDASLEMMAMGITALRVLSLAWICSVTSLVFASTFQGFGLGTYSMILNMCRQVLFLFIFVTLLKPMGLTYVWVAFIISELCAVPVGICLLNKVKKNLIHPLS